MTPMISKNVHELHIKGISQQFKDIIFRVTGIIGEKSTSSFVRKTLAEKCKEVLNGNVSLDTIFEDLDYLNSIIKEKK